MFWIGLFYGPDMDKRDLAIRRTALRAGFIAFLAVYFFGLTGALIWMLSRRFQTVTIDIHLMFLIPMLPLLVILLVSSIATIILYRRGVVHGES